MNTRGGLSRPFVIPALSAREGVRALPAHETALEGDRDGLRACVDAELRQDVLDVRRHRLRADDERARDLTLRSPFGEEREDLVLSRTEIRIVAMAVAIAIAVAVGREGG